MNNARLDFVKQAFQSLDETGQGYIPLEEVLKKYNAAAHPRVRTREKTPEQVYKDFETAITKKAYYLFLTS